MKKLYCSHVLLLLFLFLTFNLQTFTSLVQGTIEITASANNWETSTPEEQGINSKKLDELKNHIKTNYSDIYSMVIIRNSFLVEEEYFRYTAATKRNIYSCTKSFISALIGIAIQEDFIESIDKPVLEFFPDQIFANVDDRKQNMTLYHLLTMTTGLEWYELQVGYNDQNNSLYRMWESKDWIQYVLDQKMIEEPGKEFNYNTGASHVMSAIINKTTGMSTLEFAKSRLFGPLGINDYFWPTDPNDIHTGGEGLELTPRSLAKLGQLYLNNGTWKGQQIVPKKWVVNSSRIDHHPSGNHTYGYGFQWWIHPDHEIFSAWGYAEQRAIVAPKFELVAVFTGYMPNTYGDLAGDLVNTFIIPAITGSNNTCSSDTPAAKSTSYLVFTLPSLFIIVILSKYQRKK